MITQKTDRGFTIVLNENDYTGKRFTRLIQESSAVGLYEDSLANPGSSFLWVGEHHLDREEVLELVVKLRYWLKNGRLALD